MTSKPILISEVMSPEPHGISFDISVNVAHQRMRNFGVRHLLVTRGERVIGLVGEDEVLSAMAVQSPDRSFTVGEIASSEPYTVLPSTLLAEVCEQMAEKRSPCVLVQDIDGEPVGVFSPVDACRVLAQHLRAKI